jgi:hypothetical protein
MTNHKIVIVTHLASGVQWSEPITELGARFIRVPESCAHGGFTSEQAYALIRYLNNAQTNHLGEVRYSLPPIDH